MTTHTPTIDVSHDQTPLPNQSFSPWLRGQTALFISQIVAILGFVSFLASLVYYVSHTSEKGEFLSPANVRLIVDYAHVVFMAVFILVLIQVLDDNERGSYRVKLVYDRVFKQSEETDEASLKKSQEQLKRSKDQLREFKRRFLWFWIGMLCLYVSFACQHTYNLPPSESHEKTAHSIDISTSVKNKNHDGQEEHLTTKVSFSTTNEATPSPSKIDPVVLRAVLPFPFLVYSLTENPEFKPLDFKGAYKQLAFPFLVFFFNNLTLLFIFWCFLVMYIPSDEMAKKDLKYRKRSGLIMAVLTLLFLLLVLVKGRGFTPDYWKAYSAVFDALSGVINAIVLALLIARLDSKLIGLPSWLISILYSYAAVQPLFLVFELSQSQVLVKIATSVLIFVFVSKIYFFLIILYALQTGKMLNYLFCFPILRERAKEHKRPNEKITSVSRWLRSDSPLKIAKVVGWISISYFFISLIGSQIIPNSTNGAGRNLIYGLVSYILIPPNVAIDYAQLLVVSGMILILYLVRKENRYGGYRALKTAEHIFEGPLKPKYSPKEGKRQVKKFKDYFLYFWCVTFFLYIALLLHHLGINFKSAEVGSIKYLLEIFLYPFLEFSLSSLNLLFIFWCFVILQSPAFDHRSATRQKRLIHYSGFVITLLIAVFLLLFFIFGGPKLSKESMGAYATVFDGLTGMLSAVALALLIARMDSKWFGLPSWSIWMLFAYASIQPLFIAFAQDDRVLKMVQTSVLTAALGLKIYFFLIVAHSLQSGKILRYLVCFPFLKERVDSIFENQFEIRLARAESNLFTFSILKKNQLYYSTTRRLKSRADCDRFVHNLRQRMKDEKSYLPPCEESGTYWVELKSDDGELICESIPLKSEEEAQALISESVDKIPYCKYNRT